MGDIEFILYGMHRFYFYFFSLRVLSNDLLLFVLLSLRHQVPMGLEKSMPSQGLVHGEVLIGVGYNTLVYGGSTKGEIKNWVS